METAIYWCRREFRITDNTPLLAAAHTARQVVPVYIRSQWTGMHRWTGPARQTFLCQSLAAFAANLESLGGRLIVRAGDPVSILPELVRETGARAVFAALDPDPHGTAVERAVAARLNADGVAFHTLQDHVLHESHEVLKEDGTPYRVFTPYAKAWTRLPKAAPAGKPRALQTPSGLQSLPLPQPSDWGLVPFAGLPEPGERAARRRMERFLSGPIFRYAADRNTPAGTTTSRLSQDLRFGLVSIRELYARCHRLALEADAHERQSVRTFVNELVWREFYFQILRHNQSVLDLEFNPKLRGIPWRRPGEDFARWCEGTTGFPIVDAAMRQLRATGFMHNRCRMIVAMFLTKDLHLDWRLGERWFMQSLTDGEIASNNGGWQWSAGTGADAAPYFRIQNPWSQSGRFDPDGRYIREWVPELRDVPAARLHVPPPDGAPLAPGYPAPMVDHAREREITLRLFREQDPTLCA